MIKRGLILVLLGILYNNAVRFDFSEMRYASVLGRIGLAWMFAALIFMNSNLKFRIIWFGAVPSTRAEICTSSPLMTSRLPGSTMMRNGRGAANRSPGCERR